MRIRGIENQRYTNRLIKWAVIAIDFVVLWFLIPFVVDSIPHSEEWDADMYHIFWTVCTLTMVLAEYWFPPVIHQRLVGAGIILKRCTMLVASQTLLSYLLLRSFRVLYHLGWPLFFMALLMWLSLILLCFAERWMLKRLRKSGYNTRKVTFIGSDPEIHRLYQKLCSNPTYGYKVRSSYVSPGEFSGLLSHPEDLHLGDEVYLCVSRKERDLIERTASMCYHRMIKFYYVSVAEEKLNLQPVFIDDMEVMATYTSPLEDPLNRLLKRVADILLSILFLIPLVLLLPFFAAIIKFQSPGPVFVRQRHTGLGGREFHCYKFRSKHVNTDVGSPRPVLDDFHRFPFGNFIRRTRMDKLPQFWNVLIGNMSVVGPHPHIPSLTEQYDKLIDKYMLRHFVKPGITGWTQITGFREEMREPCQMEERIERDIWYIQHWSFWLDMRIIWLTFKTFFNIKKF